MCANRSATHVDGHADPYFAMKLSKILDCNVANILHEIDMFNMPLFASLISDATLGLVHAKNSPTLLKKGDPQSQRLFPRSNFPKQGWRD